MGWACGVYGWGDGVYRVLVWKPEGNRPLGKPRRRWVNNIRNDLQAVGCGYMDWIGFAQDRDWWRTLVSAVMNLRVPWNARNFLTSRKPVSFSRRTLYHGVSKQGVWAWIWVWGWELVITVRNSTRKSSFVVEAKDDIYCNCTEYIIRGRSKNWQVTVNAWRIS